MFLVSWFQHSKCSSKVRYFQHILKTMFDRNFEKIGEEMIIVKIKKIKKYQIQRIGGGKVEILRKYYLNLAFYLFVHSRIKFDKSMHEIIQIVPQSYYFWKCSSVSRYPGYQLFATLFIDLLYNCWCIFHHIIIDL